MLDSNLPVVEATRLGVDEPSALAAKVQALAQEVEQLRRALETRDIIGQAKGMVMERFHVDAMAAFDLLVKLSQRSNTPVAVIAQKLVDADHPTRKGRSGAVLSPAPDGTHTTYLSRS
ncbi:ANTAR domain-containing response regulator [Mycobacterium sp. 852002-51971_SCH5477799-a]|uniref:ANTAR domain-containing response regulator n=1 Tax=Mycobacterium sp. 852002-51971_SCH5477799-a TaxID=1834106 RepID=UPI0009EF07EE|nr:ANTAR domain-containing protein [Mycobacterium sp. 852002-51971_SCH5477799-a]